MNADQLTLEPDAELTRKQNQRVFLRQRFLQFLNKTVLLPEGCPANIVLHEGSLLDHVVKPGGYSHVIGSAVLKYRSTFVM